MPMDAGAGSKWWAATAWRIRRWAASCSTAATSPSVVSSRTSSGVRRSPIPSPACRIARYSSIAWRTTWPLARRTTKRGPSWPWHWLLWTTTRASTTASGMMPATASWTRPLSSSSDSLPHPMRRLSLREDLAQALERGELTIHYQPILDLASSEVVAVEALARWERPSGMVGPTEFIPIAEETGLIVPIGRWVLETACREIRSLDAAQPGRELRGSVNVSAVQLEREDFANEVSTVLHETGLAPGRLILELTESLLLERSEPTLASMRRIRQLGVRLAIDDFGTGYSSLSYLPELPVDMLKIDRSFVVGLDSGRESLAVVRSIIRLAATLGLVTLAEGIERPEQAARLRTIGAELGQGYYFARPLTTPQLATYLAGDASEAAGAAG